MILNKKSIGKWSEENCPKGRENCLAVNCSCGNSREAELHGFEIFISLFQLNMFVIMVEFAAASTTENILFLFPRSQRYATLRCTTIFIIFFLFFYVL